ncbi:hypothetical protein DFH09DRAFT_216991 [Mycena vulgaris]|nr:hypothetical protein DFH09DRAFT_216991 [Mycena vulgaris]
MSRCLPRLLPPGIGTATKKTSRRKPRHAGRGVSGPALFCDSALTSDQDAAPPAALPPPPDLADPEDIKLLIQDMAGISARNKLYMKQAIAMRAQTLKIQEQAEELRIAFRVEQLRRERMEQYLKCWRATDPEWSYSAVWDGDITVAPVLARFDNAKASMVMDQEVSTSDDEALVDQWHVQHEAFAARKKAKQGKVVEPISDEEFESDEEEFYSPFVLRPDEDDGTASDSECQVFPHFDLTSAILMNRPEPQIIVRQSGKRSLDTTVESDDDARYFPRARIEPATEDKGKAKMSLEELEDAEQLAWDRSVAEALGEEDVDENWEGLGGFRSGWRMDVYRA